MKTMEDVIHLKVGESMVIPWTNLPSPRPEKGACFGNQVQFYIAEPKDDGLEVRRVQKAEAMEYRKQCEAHIGSP
jgi:hypothetical protein